MTERNDEFGARTRLECSGGSGVLYRIQKLAEDGIAEVSRLPYSIKNSARGPRSGSAMGLRLPARTSSALRAGVPRPRARKRFPSSRRGW